ncbi:MAG: hypothetical protein NWE89_01285 [Candidatus Bathyarchaeota archaeon]|nr:hypothetical protein [Candidatus Bathyarchaeota archaeon]
MSKRLLRILTLTLLILSLAIVPASADSDKPVVVAHLKGALEPDIQLAAILGNMTSVDWRVVLGDLTADDLDGAKMLIMSMSDSSQVYSAAELDAVDDWYSAGGKTLWVAADSDYGTDHMRQATCNSVLEAVGSKLRIDDCSAEDAVSNGGAPYRVLGVSDNADSEIDFLVEGVERGLFHGPGIVVGYVGGSYVNLMEEDVDGVFVVITTSETGIIVDNSEPVPNVMVAGEEGEFPLMAIEIDYDTKSVIIGTGEAPFDQYAGLYAPEIRRYDRYGPDANPQQGATLFENIVAFATVFGDDIMGLRSEVWGLEDDVTGLEGDVSDCEDDNSDLAADIAGLQSEVSSLESDVAQLEADVAAAQSSASTMQLAAVAALVIGLIIGFILCRMQNQ